MLHFCYQDVTSDDGDFTNGLAGMIYPDEKRGKTQCGKIGLWAWAAGRVMDYACTVPEIDHDRIGVVGHSRLGKTALLAGALDERFFLCIFQRFRVQRRGAGQRNEGRDSGENLSEFSILVL